MSPIPATPAADAADSRPASASSASRTRTSDPLLAQVQSLHVSGATGDQVTDLITALQIRARSHPGHIAPLGTAEAASGEQARVASLWRSPLDLRTFAAATRDDVIAWRRRTGARLRWDRVLWWVPAGHRPAMEEAAERLDQVLRSGPGPSAFTLRSPVPPPRS